MISRRGIWRLLGALLPCVVASSCNYYRVIGDDDGLTDVDGGDDDVTVPVVPDSTLNVTVLEYCPAPGQFVNVLPEYADGDTEADMCAKATELIERGALVTLGGWGGYIVMRVDPPITTGRFRVLGNAFAGPAPNGSGAAEPGVVSVSYDSNGNGVADDEWFQIHGSATETDYSMTYFYADETWTASDGSTGSVQHNAYHLQPYFPQWLSAAEALTFHGTLLESNGYYDDTLGQYVLQAFDYGYADSWSNTDERSALVADVDLPQIDFIRVQTGVNQSFPTIGETSTEVCGVQVLSAR